MIISFHKLSGVWRWSGSLALDWEFGAGVRSLALGSTFYHALHLPNHELSISYPTHSPIQPQVPIPILRIGMNTCDDMWPSTNPSVCNVALLCEVVAGALKSASDRFMNSFGWGDQANRPCVRLRFLPSTLAPDSGVLYHPGRFKASPCMWKLALDVART